MRLLVPLLLACAPAPEPPAAHIDDVADVAPPPATDAPSIYELDPALVDHTGQPVTLDVYAGQPVLISMFYGSCKAACPILISDIKRVDAALQDAGVTDVGVLMVSFDPANDTPDVLHGLVEQHTLGDHWTLAAPTDASERTLSAVLDISWRDVGNGRIQHDSFIILLDAQGRQASRLEGLGLDPDPLVQAALAL